jgi:hypothetical protein
MHRVQVFRNHQVRPTDATEEGRVVVMSMSGIRWPEQEHGQLAGNLPQPESPTPSILLAVSGPY